MQSQITNLKRKFRGSAYLNTSNSDAVTTLSKVFFDLDDRFKPYNEVQIINLNEDNDCLITINHIQQIILPAGNSEKITIPVSTIEIQNIGTTTINANELRCFYRNDGFQGKDIMNNIVSGFNILNGFSGFLR